MRLVLCTSTRLLNSVWRVSGVLPVSSSKHLKLQQFHSYSNPKVNGVLFKHQEPKISPEEEKFIVRSPYSDVEIPEVNLADFVWRDVHKWPDRPSFVTYW